LPDPLSPADRSILLDIADRSIREGLAGRRALRVDASALPAPLAEPGAAFVTVRVGDQLNGCIGSIEPVAPLGLAVARHAWDAAFSDPRLPRLRGDEYEHTTIEVSVLSPLEPIGAASEEQLLAEIRPGEDGLVIAAQGRRGLFLPVVWESLPDARDFLRHLQAKAGLPVGWWPPDMTAHRFSVDKFERAASSLVQ
jgi:AmmeMemoRadiSam system protein A